MYLFKLQAMEWRTTETQNLLHARVQYALGIIYYLRMGKTPQNSLFSAVLNRLYGFPYSSTNIWPFTFYT